MPLTIRPVSLRVVYVAATRAVLLAVTILAGARGSALAADRVEKGTVFSIDTSKGVVVQMPGNTETAIGESNTFTTRRNETVRVDILRYNPLLFTYDATNTKSDTTEYAAALEFAKQLQALLAFFPASGASDIRQSTIQGIDLEQLRKDLEVVRELFTSLSGDLAASMGAQAQVEALKKKYSDRDIEALAKRIEAALSAITAIVSACQQANPMLANDAGQPLACDGPIALDNNVTLTRKVADYRTREADLLALDKRIAAEENKLAAAKGALAAAATSERAAKTTEISAIEDLIRGLRSVRADRKTDIDDRLESLRRDKENMTLHPTLFEFASRVEATAALVLRQLDTLRAVSADVAALGTPRPVITVPYSVQKQTITISIGAQSKFDRFIDAETRRRRDAQIRKLTLVLEPYQPAHLSIAPAFVLGFLRNPDFSAVKDGDAFKIQKKDSELTRYTGGVMLNITPDGWQEPTFGGHFQVGVSPVKDSLGFFFGAGIRAQNLFSFGAGLMIQQVRRLGDGQTLETRLDDPAKLKLDREFKRALYLHITVSIPR